jgi:glycosyltransferase involved in cell wall biosynthesis
MPAISVLMPVWNGLINGDEKFLTMAIESVLDQTYTDLEFIIVDDGSADRTPQVLGRYAASDKRVKMLRSPTNEGIVAALNKGLKECNSPYVARMDADDISTVTRLEIQKGFLDARPGTAMCGTAMYVINEEGKLVMHINDRPCNYSVVKEFLKYGSPFVHGSVMFRKNVILEVGGYSPDPRFKHAEDYELWVRLAKTHVVENIPGATLYFHRNHRSKISEVYKGQQEKATALIASIAQATL